MSSCLCVLDSTVPRLWEQACLVLAVTDAQWACVAMGAAHKCTPDYLLSTPDNASVRTDMGVLFRPHVLALVLPVNATTSTDASLRSPSI